MNDLPRVDPSQGRPGAFPPPPPGTSPIPRSTTGRAAPLSARAWHPAGSASRLLTTANVAPGDIGDIGPPLGPPVPAGGPPIGRRQSAPPPHPLATQPPPPPPPPHLRPGAAPAVATPHMWWAALVVGAAANIGVRSGTATIAGTAAVMVAIGALRWTAARHRAASWLLVAAATLAPWLMWRDSSVLLVANLLVICGLVGGSAVAAKWDRVTDIDLGRLLAVAPRVMVTGLSAPAFLLRPTRAVLGGGVRSDVARGIALAAPILVVMGALLANGDVVFGSLFRLIPSPGPIVGHLLTTALLALPMGGLLAIAEKRRNLGAAPDPRRFLGATEGAVVLAGLVTLYAVFAATQLVAALGGANTVLETAGLTHAEYARNGFFDLLWVAALTLVVLVALQLVTVRGSELQHRRFVGLGLTAVILTEVIVIGAVIRLFLYASEFGWTMLRLASTGLALWIGAVFVLLGMDLAFDERGRSWFVGSLLAMTTGFLLLANMFNPEAFVVNHNIDHAASIGRLDLDYLDGLSADGSVRLLERLDDLPVEVRGAYLEDLCRRDAPKGPGVLAGNWNRGRARYADARTQVCRP